MTTRLRKRSLQQVREEDNSSAAPRAGVSQTRNPGAPYMYLLSTPVFTNDMREDQTSKTYAIANVSSNSSTARDTLQKRLRTRLEESPTKKTASIPKPSQSLGNAVKSNPYKNVKTSPAARKVITVQSQVQVPNFGGPLFAAFPYAPGQPTATQFQPPSPKSPKSSKRKMPDLSVQINNSAARGPVAIFPSQFAIGSREASIDGQRQVLTPIFGLPSPLAMDGPNGRRYSSFFSPLFPSPTVALIRSKEASTAITNITTTKSPQLMEIDEDGEPSPLPPSPPSAS